MKAVRKTIPLRLATAPLASTRPSTEAEVLTRLLARARAHQDAAGEALLERYLAASRRLVFKEARRAADGRAQWTVTGAGGREVTFTSKRPGMRLAHRLAAGEVLDGDEGVRLQVKRALRELAKYAPALAEELRRGFSVSGWTARYQPDARSPAIDT